MNAAEGDHPDHCISAGVSCFYNVDKPAALKYCYAVGNLEHVLQVMANNKYTDALITHIAYPVSYTHLTLPTTPYV